MTWAALSPARRLAVAVLAEGAVDAAYVEAEAHRLAAEELAQALAGDRIDQLFLHAAEARGLAPRLPSRLLALLRARRTITAAILIRQEHALDEASALLDAHGVEHLVLKGALLRQLCYRKPHLRPGVDVDLLLAPDTLPAALRLLGQQGYASGLAAHSDTHEIGLTRHDVVLDLHWSLLRPGRMRQDITREMLAHRLRRGRLWGPSDVHLAVAMLVHPAITDYVTGRLISAVDLDRCLRQHVIPWDGVTATLARLGLRTAAWVMLRWTTGLFATPVPDEVMRALSPSAWRQRYLEAWLARHPAQLYARRPNLVRGGFSLALQDRPRDAARALWRLACRRRLTRGEVPAG